MFKSLTTLFTRDRLETPADPVSNLRGLEAPESPSTESSDLLDVLEASFVPSGYLAATGDTWEDVVLAPNTDYSMPAKAALHRFKKLLNSRIKDKDYLDIVYPTVLTALNFTSRDLFDVLATLENQGYKIELQNFISEWDRKVIRISWR